MNADGQGKNIRTPSKKFSRYGLALTPAGTSAINKSCILTSRKVAIHWMGDAKLLSGGKKTI
jgi:hypothetical protein